MAKFSFGKLSLGKTSKAVLVALFLTTVAIAIFTHKIFSANLPLLPTQVYESWYVEAKIAVQSDRSLFESEESLPQTIQVRLPQSSPGYVNVRENFSHDGYNLSQTENEETGNRIAVFDNQGTTGQQFLFYRGIFDRRQSLDILDENVLPAARRLVDQAYRQGSDSDVKDNLQENLPDEEIQALLSEAKQVAANDDETSPRLALTRALYRLALAEDDLRVQALRSTLQATNPNQSAAKLTVFLLQQDQIPARLGNGIVMTQEETYSTDFVNWIEVEEDEQWQTYDPISDNFGAQDRYLTWWYGTTQPITTDGEGVVQIEVLVRPNTDQGLSQTAWQDSRQENVLIRYSFLRLPLASQRVLQILVLIPVGALIISVLHQMIGIPTFGTFTPILISLAFRETGLLVGIPLFMLIVCVGLLLRAYLNHLQLLVVPRLASILTATVLIISFFAVLFHDLQITFGLSVSLFPIVILAMTIERAALIWEEEGAKEALVAALGSIFVSVLGYLCLINSYVQYFAFAFPELLLIVLALTILIGRYNGYKLVEYLRFQSLQKELQKT